MAYTYQQGVALSTADLLIQLKAFMTTTAGWTMVDDRVTTGASGQDFVVSSAGESGTERIFLRFHRLNANQIMVYSYLSWNGGTHVGQKQVGSTSATNGTGTFIQSDDISYHQYWFFASLDRAVVATRANFRAGVTDTIYAGLYLRQKSSNRAITSGTLAAGTAVSITVDTSAYFTVGKRYMLADDTVLEYPKVTSVPDGTHVIVDRLQNAYATGARLGEDPRPVILTVNSASLGWLAAGNWLQAAPWQQGAQATAATYVVRTVDLFLIERTSPEGGPDGGGSGNFNLWPLVVADEAHFDPAVLGTLKEAFITARDGIATDDTITDPTTGAVYHYINTGPMILATTSTAMGMAVRRA